MMFAPAERESSDESTCQSDCGHDAVGLPIRRRGGRRGHVVKDRCVQDPVIGGANASDDHDEERPA